MTHTLDLTGTVDHEELDSAIAAHDHESERLQSELDSLTRETMLHAITEATRE